MLKLRQRLVGYKEEEGGSYLEDKDEEGELKSRCGKGSRLEEGAFRFAMQTIFM